MSAFDWNRIQRYGIAAAFVLIALWVAWHGRKFNDENMGLLTPIMCGLVGLSFSFTGYRLLSRGEE